jgi:hypothetical protein
MTLYEFTLILDKSVEITDRLADDLFAAGCDDGTLVRINGVVQVMFDREAETLETAIRSAIGQVQQTGQKVTRVEIAAAVVGGQP